MKGMEMPINMIVVIAIAVLVLVVVAAFFAGRLGSGTASIELEGAFSQGCNTLRTIENCASTGFTVIGFKLPGESVDATFDQLCRAKGYDTEQCKRACGCQV